MAKHRLGEIFKELRENNNLTQEELAGVTGVSARTILRIEKDPEYNPSIRTFEKAASAFKGEFSVSYLMGESDDPYGYRDDEEEPQSEPDTPLTRKDIAEMKALLIEIRDLLKKKKRGGHQ